MRILLASDSFDPAVGGVQRVVKDLATTMLARGHAVAVLAPWSDGLPFEESVDGIAVHRVRLGRPAITLRAVLGFVRRLPAARNAVRDLLQRLQPDVVHLHFLQSPLAHVLPGLLAERDDNRDIDIPLVVTAHGRDVVGSMVEDDVLGRRAVRRVLDDAAAVTAPSEATLADARALAPTPLHASFRVVANGLPMDMEAVLGIPPPGAEDGDGIVAVGELHPKKGFDVLIRALQHLPGTRLRIAGTGGERDALRDLARSLGVGDRVELLGFVTRGRLPSFLRSGAVQAVPSRREPFGLVILEGFACGVPVVATRTGGIPDVVGDAALLVAPEDPTALAAALRDVLANADLRRNLVAAGRTRAAELTVARTTDLYEEIYDLVRTR